METTQRFLRRIFLLDSMELILRKAKYHRDNDEEEDLPGYNLWTWDDEQGEYHLGEKDDHSR